MFTPKEIRDTELFHKRFGDEIMLDFDTGLPHTV